MFFESYVTAFDLLGVAAFAATGAGRAAEKRMDIVGFVVLGTVTGIGGGTLRDLLLGALPVFWIRHPIYLVVCAVVAMAMFAAKRTSIVKHKVMQWVDAFALSLFAIIGAEKALGSDTGVFIAITMGVVTATFGGVIRDVLGNETPTVLTSEIYVSAAAVAAGCYCGLLLAGLSKEGAIVVGVLVGATIRLVAVHRGWSLPRAG